VVYDNISFLSIAKIPLYGYTTFCSFIHQLMHMGLFPIWGSYEECCYDHLYTGFCVAMLWFYWIYVQEWSCWFI
jgi:hypothetical protein